MIALMHIDKLSLYSCYSHNDKLSPCTFFKNYGEIKLKIFYFTLVASKIRRINNGPNY